MMIRQKKDVTAGCQLVFDSQPQRIRLYLSIQLSTKYENHHQKGIMRYYLYLTTLMHTSQAADADVFFFLLKTFILTNYLLFTVIDHGEALLMCGPMKVLSHQLYHMVQWKEYKRRFRQTWTHILTLPPVSRSIFPGVQ